MSPRLRRWLIVLGVLLLLGIAFVWSLPEIVKWQALKQIPAITGRQASIDDIDINLFTGRVAIKKFRLAEADPSQTFVEFERLDLRVIPWSGVLGNVRVAEFRLTAPTVNLVRESATEFNFSDILRRLAASKEGAPPPPPPEKPPPKPPDPDEGGASAEPKPDARSPMLIEVGPEARSPYGPIQ